ncbi:hypothetical protein [Streptomyces sp. NPDC003090]|uniref:hypothetical protein n=1 Tax=Streptomyces sp. NPDC003090 TaxID=3154274 RepID=UPI0038138E68
MAATLALAGCVLTQTPRSPYFGFRLDSAGNLIVAYPLCPSREVYGAQVQVEAPAGSGESFTTVWHATRPASEEARSGVFVVGNKDSFLNEHKPLRGGLPDGFHVWVTELVEGKTDEGQADWVVPSRLKGTELKPGEYLTPEGDVVTRADINAQALCNDPRPGPGR